MSHYECFHAPETFHSEPPPEVNPSHYSRLATREHMKRERDLSRWMPAMRAKLAEEPELPLHLADAVPPAESEKQRAGRDVWRYRETRRLEELRRRLERAKEAIGARA